MVLGILAQYVWSIKSAWAGEAKASKASIETKIFSGFWGIPCWETTFSAWLLRVFYLSPSREIIRSVTLSVAYFGHFKSRHGLYWNFFSSGVFDVLSLVWMLGAPLGCIFWRGSHVSLLDLSGEIEVYPFSCKISFLDFHWLVNLSWYQMGKEGRCPLMFQVFFFLLSKYLFLVSLKHLK